jgi:hypothetical protein
MIGTDMKQRVVGLPRNDGCRHLSPSGGSRRGPVGIDRPVAQPQRTSAGREGWRKTCLA